ncbi:DUF167 domain-containing protein [Hymenobacter sp. BT770]|uniref:DUF167 domain-containing protein n=1 Tax=Hymenobacter sp. BT770 TaxID=2886942 RepID=UPI001D102577|nr:DUF167 domain-containing protein [Hymenobacter sp. BT770]MCC3153904.1 DUF167 domain-containing protein [Hymenobacter sp. BT770]MDO3416048.1 DUF167 domain-containing protein [Hymenobacter sp. BT770]
MFTLHLRAKPEAKTTALQVAADGSVTVRLKAPAQDGKANACLLAYLAEVFGVSKSSVELLSGHTAPFKKVRIGGVDEAAGQAVLARLRTPS